MIYILVHLICGFEWHLHGNWFVSQIDLTWWFTWYDLQSQNWKSEHSTLVLFEVRLSQCAERILKGIIQ